MPRPLVAFCLGIALLTAACRCPAAAYIKFDGVDGESTDRGHEGWSDLTAFSVDYRGGTTQAASIAMRFSMQADKSYPELVEGVGRRGLYDTIEVDLTDEAGGQLFAYELRRGGVTDLSIVHDAYGGARLVGTLITQEMSIEHVPSGAQTLWDYSGTAAGFAPLPGDFDYDGDVDADDYAKWRENYATMMGNIGGGPDANADGRVDMADYTVWRANYSGPNLLGPAAAPEPMTLALALLLAPAALVRRKRR
ncbi:hypothetical protein Pla123a_48940 [Posidoniimonas polymericola]|uniref:PEP-CTERM protein-sorting domain-containing protein n=1 Tax=Posidoniimonas polymericola TaxID=2528002 RepID=A0A5C5XQC6_9BACT|nr:type VI secretion system tube protein Hcp [Posidoniimonas polymericola]TWT65426.1 hypothetical protein Pla123a_48940 [Posidoniimonas polymericola]